MDTKKNVSSVTVIFIFAGIIVILMGTLIGFKAARLSKLNHDIHQLEDTLQENLDKLMSLQYLASIQPGLEFAYETLNKQLPDEPMESEIIHHIQNIALENKSKLLDIYFSDRVASNELMMLPMKLTFSGSYTSLIKVIEELDHSERLFRIDEIKISKSNYSLSDINAEIIVAAFSRQ